MQSFITPIWNTVFPPARTFGWKSILASWAKSPSNGVPSYVETILENYRRVTEVGHDLPLTHFISYLNYEPEGIKWFLYEVLHTSGYEYDNNEDYVRECSDSQLEFLSGLLDWIAENDSLDSTFPVFPVSPLGGYTIRTYVEQYLSKDNLKNVAMMPRLISVAPSPQATFVTPTRDGRSAPRTVTPPLPPRKSKKYYPLIVIRLMRSGSLETKEDDDIISIKKEDSIGGIDSFSYIMRDRAALHSNRTITTGLSHQGVMALLRVTLQALVIDVDPYAYLQVFTPNMPTYMVDIDTMNKRTRSIIIDSVDMAMSRWATSTK